MGNFNVRAGSGAPGDPPFIPEIESTQVIPPAVWFAWMAIYVLSAVIFTVWFGIRGIKYRLQPIAAREPRFVIAGSVISILWTSLLCMQRAFDEQFPCWLTLWSGVGGGVFLLNVYLLRALFLYSNFNLTQDAIDARKAKAKYVGGDKRLLNISPNGEGDDSSEDSENHHLSVQDRRMHAHTQSGSFSGFPSAGNSEAIGVSSSSVGTDSSSVSAKPKDGASKSSGGTVAERFERLKKRFKEWFKRNHRLLISRKFLIPMQIFLVCAVLGRATHVTIVSEEVKHHRGDGCPLAWQGSATALASYAGVCACLFSMVGFGLRGKLDAFWIKKELKWVGISAIPTAIGWYILNNVDFFTEFNKKSSLSTILLLLVVTIVFVAGVIFPLYRSYYDPPEVNVEAAVEVKDLVGDVKKLLQHKAGIKAFDDYLASEFAVHHLYFWEDINRLESSMKRCKAKRIEDGSEKTVERYQRIIATVRQLYSQYIVEESEQMVNIGRTLQRPIIELHDRLEEESSEYTDVDTKSIDEALSKLDEIHKHYEKAQKDVEKMLRNSHRRFKRSTQYEELVAELEQEKIDREMQVRKMHGGGSVVIHQSSTLTRTNGGDANGGGKSKATPKAKSKPKRLATLSASRRSDSKQPLPSPKHQRVATLSASRGSAEEEVHEAEA